MGTPISVFPVDRSRRWIIAAGIASTRQILARNDSSDPVELHLKVEEPGTASVSPAIVALNSRQSRTVDVILLADWSPDRDKRIVISLRDAQGNLLVNFAQELIAADSSDCSVTLTWKEPVLIDGTLSGVKLYCTLTSRSATPRTFEVDFTPHPALRFPERKKVTLEPGDSTTFEVPIEWHRNVHDATGWNHPRVIEVTVPVSQGRRTAVVLWEAIEPELAQYLTDEDRAPTAVLPPDVSAAPPFPGHVEQPGSDADYQRLLSQKQLEQAVVGPAQTRTRLTTSPELSAPMRRNMSLTTRATLVIAIVALVVAAVFYLRPQEPGTNSLAYRVSPAPLVSLTPPPVKNKQKKALPAKAAAVAAAMLTSANTNAPQTFSQAAPSAHPRSANTPVPAPATAATASATEAPPRPAATIDRGAAIVALADPEVSYASGGRAVAITWYVQAQDHALIHVLNDQSVIIAQSTVPGTRSHAVIRLPRGYHGGVSVEVIAIGYHGERVVQSASLSPPGT